jgi:hypothetical protein
MAQTGQLVDLCPPDALSAAGVLGYEAIEFSRLDFSNVRFESAGGRRRSKACCRIALSVAIVTPAA